MAHPLARWKRAWDWMIIAFVVFVAVWIPWDVGFQLPRCGSAGANPGECTPDGLAIFDTFVDVCFWADMVLVFFTGVVDTKKNARTPHHAPVPTFPVPPRAVASL